MIAVISLCATLGKAQKVEPSIFGIDSTNFQKKLIKRKKIKKLRKGLVGKNMVEVRNILGRPSNTEKKNGEVVMHYIFSRYKSALTFQWATLVIKFNKNLIYESAEVHSSSASKIPGN